MKKLVVLTMVVALFIGIPVCIFAQEEPRSAPWCNMYAARFPDQFAAYFKNLGECVSYIQACSKPRDDPALCGCKYIRMVNPQGYEDTFGTQGLGPCVSSFRTDASY